ncbi:uncharacterized protein MYCFIDRAFT_81022 [Pseudocercospora fijiensis CIRAD86]|uniref:Uncharacterized protein n=1 Tax=Pseudocercospora fijiensis (strain CIRAD86) TaxID=383855 RepID=M2ZLE1_PSEFD|nr:uncharacterized protein MYCFIDRAFT_81022 [Pseudocercospora fijiensis CIRAD86]EME79889.1 hypothetical protein MYCFIDRAFT_81022 [Pseudocercospora fijiensis CIRAD86]
MKFEIAALLLAAGPLVQAIAVAEPMANAEPKKRIGAWTFCGVPGAACKRDADADAKKRIGAWTFCGVPGAACHRLKRSADAIADAFADPEAKKRIGAWTFCGVPGAACHKARRGLLETGDVAERAVADLEARDADAKKKKRIGAWTFCGVPGAACKRDAEAEAKKKRIGAWTFCGVPGAACKREAEAEAKKKRIGAWTFCGVPGAACKRDVDSSNIENIVRSINEYDPSHFKRECFSAGGECAALVKAHRAFHAIKRESELLSSQPLSRRQEELDEDDDEEVHAFVDLAERGVIDSEVVKRSEEACHETDGDCTIAAASLYSIENALNEAINALDEE